MTLRRFRDHLPLPLICIVLLANTACRDADSSMEVWKIIPQSYEEWTPLLGHLEAADPVTFRAERNGISKLIDLAEDGTPVQTGDIIARFDQAELKERIRNIQRDRDIAQATLTALKEAEHPLELQRLRQDLLVVHADLAKEQALKKETEALIAEDLLAPEELEIHAQALLQLESRKAALEQQLQLTEHILHPSKQKTAVARLDASEATLQELQQQLDATLVKAPADGTVHLPLIPIDGEQRPARIGDGIFRNQVYLQLSDLTRLVIRAEMGERLLSKIAPGMNANVRFPAMPDRIFQAQVTQVGAYPRGSGRRYPVELQLLEPPQVLRPGLTAHIEVLSFRTEDALLVPHAFITRENGTPVVTSRSGTHEVEIHTANPEYVLITSGIEAGMEVLLP